MPLRQTGRTRLQVGGVKTEHGHETERQRTLVGVSDLIEQLGSLLASETDLASDTPVEVLVGWRRHALLGTQAELDNDSRPLVTLLTASSRRYGRAWPIRPWINGSR